MRTSDYLERKGITDKPKNTSRYVTNRIKSHKRPVEKKYASQHPDDPSTRGLTK